MASLAMDPEMHTLLSSSMVAWRLTGPFLFDDHMAVNRAFLFDGHMAVNGALVLDGRIAVNDTFIPM